MKKIVISKKIISSLVIITIALIVIMIIFSIKNNKNDRSKGTVEAISYETIEENINTNDENADEIMNIEDFENESIDEQNEEDKNSQNKSTKNENQNKSSTKEEDNTPKYYIKINNRANRVNVYEKDGDGNYTKLVRAMICSTGEYTPPCSLYKKTKYKMLGNRSEWAKFHSVYVRYPTRIVGGIFFHSVPYLTKSKDGLSYSMFDKLGQSVSAGCIRLQLADAKWIYDNVEKGTTVEFNTSVTNNAKAPKISSNDVCRDWDPTDTDSNNPWKNPSVIAKKNENTNVSINNSLDENKNNTGSSSNENSNVNTNTEPNENKNINTNTNLNEDINASKDSNKGTNTNTSESSSKDGSTGESKSLNDDGNTDTN